LPHGRYEVRSSSGELRVVGAFNAASAPGRSSSERRRLASRISADDDVRSGTLATWYEARHALRARTTRRVVAARFS
jgi:hypothetical protein